MKFSDITKAVHDAWTFAWPPLVLCAITYRVATFLNRDGTDAFLQEIVAFVKTSGAQLENARSLLEPYGLTTLVPITSAILVVGFLYLLNSPVMIIVSNLPPHISYAPYVLFGCVMSQEERVILLRRYPSAEYFIDAFYLSFDAPRAGAEGNVSWGLSGVDLYEKMSNFVKFAFAVSLILVFVNIRSGLGLAGQLTKFSLLLLLLAMIWCAIVVGLLYRWDYHFWRKWGPTLSEIRVEAQSMLTAPSENEVFRTSLNQQTRWWRIYFYDASRLAWFRRTFLPTGRPPNIDTQARKG